MKTAAFLLNLLPHTLSFFFQTSNPGCGCAPCAQSPICPANPTCPPVQQCDVVEWKKNREKRDTQDDVVKVDSTCNNEDLRAIIIENIDRVTAISKRQILAEIERTLSGRYNVICARADLSYITNTEEFCQQTVGDVTCFVFKQLSDSFRARVV